MNNNCIGIVIGVVFVLMMVMVLVSMFQRNIGILNCVNGKQSKTDGADHETNDDASAQGKGASADDLINEGHREGVDLSIESVVSQQLSRS